ncbi:hypothetical protein OF83DRAFT_1179840 [Amylostereum chailletii]|nr:hypothetical protein OF83DRAFT_1179840 [Amylostereum chailletii]
MQERAAHEASRDMFPLPAFQHDMLPSTQHIVLKGDRIFRHQYMTVNFTTYDVRRDQDVIAPDAQRNNIMMLAARSWSSESAPSDQAMSPFCYARVIGIFHANVVRWYEQEAFANGNTWESRCLERLSFPMLTNKNAFDIVDPADVIRGCHIIPAFSLGRRNEDGASSSCHVHDEDWNAYFINRFVNRDMVMRHH